MWVFLFRTPSASCLLETSTKHSALCIHVCDALHAHSCLLSAARVQHVPGRGKCTGERGDGCVSTPPRGRESIAAPWHRAAGILGLAARHHGRVMMQWLGEGEKERDCSSGWLCVCRAHAVCLSMPDYVSWKFLYDTNLVSTHMHARTSVSTHKRLHVCMWV